MPNHFSSLPELEHYEKAATKILINKIKKIQLFYNLNNQIITKIKVSWRNIFHPLIFKTLYRFHMFPKN